MPYKPIYQAEKPRTETRSRSRKGLAFQLGGVILLVVIGAQLGQGFAASTATQSEVFTVNNTRQRLIASLNGALGGNPAPLVFQRVRPTPTAESSGGNSGALQLNEQVTTAATTSSQPSEPAATPKPALIPSLFGTPRAAGGSGNPGPRPLAPTTQAVNTTAPDQTANSTTEGAQDSTTQGVTTGAATEPSTSAPPATETP